MIRDDERYWANMVIDVIDKLEYPLMMYEGEKMIVRKALKAYLEANDRKTEPQTCSVNGRPYSDCGNCEYFRCTADEPQTDYGDYERAVEQMQHDMRYEPTYNAEDGSM